MHEMPGKKNMHRAYALCIFFFPDFFVLADAGALPARLKAWDEDVSRYFRPDFISL